MDRRIEAMVLGDLRRQQRIALLLGVAVLLALVTSIRFRFAGRVEADLFFMVIVTGCFFFRERGLWLLPPMLALFHWSGLHVNLDLASRVFQDALEFAEWTFLGLFTIVSLNKYSEIKRYENRVRTDMKLAMTLQRSLMPKDFESRGVRIKSAIHQSMDIGGDFYFFRPFKEKYVIFCLGDIMGKGISASLVMAMVLGFFYEWGKLSFSPSFILSKLNERLISVWGEDAPSFATLFYSIYDEETRELVYASGGHHGAVWLKPDGSTASLKTDGIPLGIFDTYEWEEKKIVLAPGDRVVVFTDGVNEARNAAGEIYTMDRVVDVLKEFRQTPPDTLIHALLEQVRRFTDGAEVTDDMAIMAMEVRL